MPGHEAEVRQLVTQALINKVAPGARTAVLIMLLHALRCEYKIVDPGEAAYRSSNSGRVLRRLPGATGHRKPSAR